MIKKPLVAVTIVSIILVIYCVLINFGICSPLVYFIFGISPLLLGWVAYTIIRFGIYRGKEFDDNEEWGYQDKRKEELDIL